jgi:hypothetical protein
MTLWSQIANERKYQVTTLAENSEAYILKDKTSKSVGTIEFVPCDVNLLEIDDFIDISNETRILQNLKYSYQVRKMGVKREFASKTILLELLKLAALQFRIEKVGEEVMFGKKRLVPVLIDVEDAIQNTEGYPIYIKPIAYLVKSSKKVKAFFA